MSWIKNNDRRPAQSGYYHTRDSQGFETGTSFSGYHWHSISGHPIEFWEEQDEIVSNCCGAKTYSPDNESYTCMDCKEPCTPVNLNEEEE